MTSEEVVLAAISAGVGALCGGVGGAFGATAAVKQILAALDKRVNRVEQRVGVTEDGMLTGNGILHDLAEHRRNTTYMDRRVTRIESHMPHNDRPEDA